MYNDNHCFLRIFHRVYQRPTHKAARRSNDCLRISRLMSAASRMIREWKTFNILRWELGNFVCFQSRTRIYRTRLYRIKFSVPIVQNNRNFFVYIGFRIHRMNFAVRKNPIYPSSTVHFFNYLHFENLYLHERVAYIWLLSRFWRPSSERQDWPVPVGSVWGWCYVGRGWCSYSTVNKPGIISSKINHNDVITKCINPAHWLTVFQKILMIKTAIFERTVELYLIFRILLKHANFRTFFLKTFSLLNLLSIFSPNLFLIVF